MLSSDTNFDAVNMTTVDGKLYVERPYATKFPRMMELILFSDYNL